MSNIINMRSKQSIKGLLDMIDHINKHTPTSKCIIYELGCYQGEGTEIFANYFDKVYAVDPWQNGYDNTDKASYACEMTKVEKEFDTRLSKYINVIKLKTRSIDIINTINDNSIDFVYIDAIHTYESCLSDIKLWLPKIKTNFFIGGHDYHKKWNGVMKAVDEVFGKPDLVFKDHSWVVCKKYNYGLQ
jgi:hypothetical protein